MLGLGKMFGRNKNRAAETLNKLTNKDLAEAMVGGCALVAFADGECEQSEVDKTMELLRTNKALSGFTGEIQTMFNGYCDRLRAGFRIGREEIMREIADVKADPKDKVDVLLAMLTVAEADGEIEPEEKKILERVASELGLRLEDYL